jgi:hypothetical protein
LLDRGPCSYFCPASLAGSRTYLESGSYEPSKSSAATATSVESRSRFRCRRFQLLCLNPLVFRCSTFRKGCGLSAITFKDCRACSLPARGADRSRSARPATPDGFGALVHLGSSHLMVRLGAVCRKGPDGGRTRPGRCFVSRAGPRARCIGWDDSDAWVVRCGPERRPSCRQSSFPRNRGKSCAKAARGMSVRRSG